ncbi:hypothetical protein ACUN0C_02045 [Faunimonas sp. B44]|uniref:hypothetical protein n=1 Tax=Faunimonas sp. B44 TaxID=3461493 RepID=UPI004043CCF6
MPRAPGDDFIQKLLDRAAADNAHSARDPRFVARDICSELDSLEVRAQEAGLQFVAYLIEMAKAEANRTWTDGRITP